MKIRARGWPWQHTSDFWANTLDKTRGQKWGWNPLSVKGMGRFGGGWAFKFGITISRDARDIVLDLGLGSIRVWLPKKKSQ